MISGIFGAFAPLASAIPPKLVSITPSGSGVSINDVITITFNQDMNQTSVENAITFNHPLTGTYSWTGLTVATFTPDSPLDYSTSYLVFINSSMAMSNGGEYFDGNGNGVAEGSPTDDKVWFFTTEYNETAGVLPEVVSKWPSGILTRINNYKIYVNFSQAMNTIETQSSFSISPNIIGHFYWQNGDQTMVYSLDETCAYNTTYTVTLDASLANDRSGEFLDGNGNGTAEGAPVDNYIWNFTTVSASQPPRVNYHQPTGVDLSVWTTTDVGIGFDDFMNMTSVQAAFNITPFVAGTFYWDDGFAYVFDTILDFSTTYTVTLSGNLTTGAKDISGFMLDGDGDGTSEGSPTDDFVWQFTTAAMDDITPPQVSANLPTGVNIPITDYIDITFDEEMNLTSVHDSFNISPYVAGEFVLFNDFSGHSCILRYYPTVNLNTSTVYTISLNGSIARDLVGNTLDGNANGTADGSQIDDFVWSFTTEASDTRPPQISWGSPMWSIDVPLDTNITFEFDEFMNETSVTNSFSIVPPTTGTFSYSNFHGRTTMVFDPTDNFLANTTYYIELNSDIAMDASGNILDGNGNGSPEGSPTDDYNGSFKTLISPGPTSPTVTYHHPTGTDVSVLQKIMIDFSSLMNHSSLTDAFSINPAITGSLVFMDDTTTTMYFEANPHLDYSTNYTVTINGSIAKDMNDEFLDGNDNGVAEGSPTDDFSWSFTTQDPDTQPPQVVDNTPFGIDAPVTSIIRVGFNEAMNETASMAGFNITPYVPGTFQFVASLYWYMEYHPDADLQPSTTYTVTLNSSIVADLAGNKLDGNYNGISELSPTDDYSWQFTTEASAPDTTPPSSSVESITPYWRNTSPLTITATASDDDSGVAYVELWYKYSPDNGTTPWTAWATFDNDTNGADGWSWSFTFPNGQGHYDFYSRAGDNAGNYEDGPASVTGCGYDTFGPTSVADSVSPLTTNASSLPISYSRDDVLSGVKNVTLWYSYSTNGTAYGAWQKFGTESVSPTFADFAFNFPSGNGYYQFYTRATDFAGNWENAPAGNDTWVLKTTGVSPPPRVSGHSPTGTNVAIATNITLRFDTAMNATSVQSAFNITPFVNGAFTWNSTRNMTFAPSSPLEYGTQYTVVINSSIAKDIDGNLLDGNGNGTAEGSPADDYSWSFTTVQAPDTTPPRVATASPTGTNVPITASISITFDELINKTSVEAAFSMVPSISGSFSWSGNDFRFTPAANLTHDTTYTVKVNGTIARDLVGNTLDGNGNGTAEGSPKDDYVWSFTTVPDTTPPAQVNDLVVTTGTTNGAIVLAWMATGDDGNSGTATSYDIRYSPAMITEANWQNATQVTGEPTPGVPSTAEQMTVSGLQPGETYYFAIKILDEVPNHSILSNVANAVAKDLSGPATPTGLTATVQENGIKLQWNAVADFDLSHYAVYRSTDNVTFTFVANVTAGTEEYLDTNIAEGTTYHYKLKAVDDNGNESPFSATVSAARTTDPIIETPTDYTMYIIILAIVIAGILGALLFLKKGRKPEIQQETVDEQDKAVDETEAVNDTLNTQENSGEIKKVE